MALIGQIAISMTTDASKFISGLSGASKSMATFQRDAHRNIGAGQKLMAGGFSQIGQGMAIAATMVGANARIIGSNMAAMAPRMIAPFKGTLAYLGDWGKAASDIIGKPLAASLGRMANPLTSAVRLWGRDMKAVYGPVFAPIGKGFSSVFKGTDFKMLGGPLGVMAGGFGKVAMGATQAGYGIAKLGLAGAVKGIQGVAGAAMGLASSLTGAAVKLGIFGAGLAVAAGYGLMKMINASSDVSEAINMVEAQFGANAPSIIAKSNEMAAAFGTSRKTYLESIGQFGGIFEGANFDNKQVADLSNQMMKLAIDARSLKNVRLDEATTKLAAGLSGEAEPLRRWGINILEANVKAQAYAMGIAKLGAELTDQQKITARLALITRGLRAAEGDRAKTAGSVANLTEEVSGRFANLAATIGGVLEPVAQSALGQVATGLTALSMAWTDNQSAVLAYFTGLVGGTGTSIQSMGLLQSAVGMIANAWQGVSIIFTQVQLAITDGIIFMVTQFEGFAAGVGKVVSYFTGLELAADLFTKTWLEDLQRMRDAQQATLTAKQTAKPASETVNAYFAAAEAKNKALQAQIAGAPKVAGEVPSAAGMVTKKPKGEFKFAKAAAAGSEESVNAILRSQYGTGAAKPGNEIKSVAKNTGESNRHLSRIAAGIEKIVGNVAPFEFMPDLS